MSKYTIQELWKIVLEHPLIEAEKEHKERLKKDKEKEGKVNE